MATIYQFQLINADNGQPIGKAVKLPTPYPFNAGDYYLFAPKQAARVNSVMHAFTQQGDDQICTAVVYLARANSTPTLVENTVPWPTVQFTDDHPVPWPW